MRETENDKLAESAYVPFLVNRSFSYFEDTVLLANQVNQWAHCDNRPQYEFYKNTVKPKKRFGKWAKTETSDMINTIMEMYQCNRIVAEQYASLLSESDLEMIKNNNNKGG